MTAFRKEVDLGEVLKGVGFTASVEALPKNASEVKPATITSQRHPDLVAFETRFIDTLAKGGEVLLGLNPKGIRVASQFAPGSRIILRYQDAQPSVGLAAVEVDAVIGPGTNSTVTQSKGNTLEIINLAKHTKEGLWIPDIDEEDIEPLLHGFSAMPAADEHGLKDEVSLVGRHGAGVVAAIDRTPAGAYLSSQGARSITYGPDIMEDKSQNNGARGFWGAVSASPEVSNATVPSPGEVLPDINSVEVEANAAHWARSLKIVLRPQHLDPIELQAGRIVPNIAKKHPEMSFGDLMLTQAARNLGGVKQAIESVKAAAEMTRMTS